MGRRVNADGAGADRSPVLPPERLKMLDTILKETLRPVLAKFWESSIEDFSRLGVATETTNLQDRFFQIYLSE